MKKWVKLVLAGLLIIFLGIVVYNAIPKEEKDNEKFAKEYTKVTDDNVFVYKNVDEIIKILENGTGIVYLGFPECPWCGEYVIYLNKTAKDNDLDKIYYYNILDARKNNTKEYQKIVELLSDYLGYDDEGNKRVYVPAVMAVNSGVIVGFDDETSFDTKGYDKPTEYWAAEGTDHLIEKLTKMMKDVKTTTCTDCNK